MNMLRPLLVLALLCSAPAFAQSNAGRPAAATVARPMPAWEQLSVAERELLIAPVRERWNSNPAGRVRMLEHARRWQTLSPEQRQRAQRGVQRWAHMSPEQREKTRALFREMRSMAPEERQALRAKWKAMTPAQREEWMREHAERNDPAE